jgi:hypothetical protein
MLLICPFCGIDFNFKKYMDYHLRDKHDLQIKDEGVKIILRRIKTNVRI